MAPFLPAPSDNQVTIKLRRLEAGNIHLPLWMFISGASRSEIQPCPSMSWLLHHAPTNTNLIFDLGISKDHSAYTPSVQQRLQSLMTVDVPQDVAASLTAMGLDPAKDIDTVIVSHLHWDHVGDPRHFGPRTHFIVGPGGLALALDDSPSTYPNDVGSMFNSALFPRDRLTELPPPPPPEEEEASKSASTYWKPLGPFPAAHDFFNDGSVIIVNAPGHLAGHINLLVRVERERWVCLAGDSCHDVRLLRGEAQTAVFADPETGEPRCAHVDKDAAERHLEKLRSLVTEEGEGKVEVILAHDWEWLEKNRGRFS